LRSYTYDARGKKMRKLLLIVPISIFVTLTLVPLSYSGYSIVQLTDDDEWDADAQINNSGHVVWERNADAVDRQIGLYDGISIRHFDVGGPGCSPQINHEGQAVWCAEVEGFSREIVFFDQTGVSQITNNLIQDTKPQLNDHGHVVWEGRGDNEDTEIFLYDGTDTIQLTDNDYHDNNPRINNNGHVLWVGKVGGLDKEIFLYDGTSINQLTDNDYNDESCSLNNYGYVVWSAKVDGGQSQPEIMLYDGTATTRLTDNEYPDRYPQINDVGAITWEGHDIDTGHKAIMLYDGIDTFQISEGSSIPLWPKINNNGYVTWKADFSHGDALFVYDGTGVSEIAPIVHIRNALAINDNNEIVFTGGPPDPSNVYLAKETYTHEEMTTPQDPVVETPDATITFETIIEEGLSTVHRFTGVPQLEGDFNLMSVPCYLYDIDTTAVFEGTVTVCIKYSEPPFFFDENQIKLLHREYGSYVDRTISLDTLNNIVCGDVDGFSYFTVACKDQAASNWGAASTTGGETTSISSAVNYLLFLLLPMLPFTALPVLRKMIRGR
jgi:hypothetical protein